MPRHAAPAERKPADARRREIADAALRVIAEQGLGHFTALTIAREVGVSDAALFRHFATKEDIVLAAIDRVEEILFERFPPQDGDAIERLGSFFRQRIGVIEQNPGIARIVASDVLAQAAPPRALARVAGFRQRSVGFIRACVDDAARAGLLARGLQPDEAVVLVTGAILALTQSRGLVVKPDHDRTIAERTWQVLESLLRGTRPGPERRSTPRRRR